jgi:hypothetical protein
MGHPIPISHFQCDQFVSRPQSSLVRMLIVPGVSTYLVALFVDNLFTLQKYVTEKFGIDSAQFNRQFGIPEDLDYL